MDVGFSEEQDALRDSVRRFLADRAPLTWTRTMLDDDRGTTADVWQGLVDLGAVGLLVPEEHGGAGRGMVDAGVVLEELGRVLYPGPFASSAVESVAAIVNVGTAAEQAELLPLLADGSLLATIVAGEPARATAPGAQWRLTGSYPFVADAVGAGLILVPAVTGDGTRLFALEREAEGLTVEPAPTVDGTSKHGSVELADALARRLGRGDAKSGVSRATDFGVTALVVQGVGAAQAALDMAVAYAKERHQFGRPVGSFQAVQHLCAEMLQAVEVGRTGAYYALWALDAADAAEGHRAATMAKAYASDAFVSVAAAAMQIFAGVGFTWEHDVHLFYKRLLTLQQSHGDAAAHYEELASLGLATSEPRGR